MAIKQTNIFPIDKQPQKAVGMAYPFSSFAISGSATPFKSNYTTKEQIKSNLIVFLITNPGERFLNPDYGGGLSEVLFEQLTDDTYDILYKKISDSLKNHFPNVFLKNLEILENPDGNEVKIVMSYTVFNNEDTLEITLNG
tara:strand:+ start:627 stop:1049 length:423 start_codon:yes stop_codon:yes gene_type:complete